MNITLADAFLLLWATVATIAYGKVSTNMYSFKYKMGVMLKALYEGDAEFVKTDEGFNVEPSKKIIKEFK